MLSDRDGSDVYQDIFGMVDDLDAVIVVTPRDDPDRMRETLDYLAAALPLLRRALDPDGMIRAPQPG